MRGGLKLVTVGQRKQTRDELIAAAIVDLKSKAGAVMVLAERLERLMSDDREVA